MTRATLQLADTLGMGDGIEDEYSTQETDAQVAEEGEAADNGDEELSADEAPEEAAGLEGQPGEGETLLRPGDIALVGVEYEPDPADSLAPIHVRDPQEEFEKELRAALDYLGECVLAELDAAAIYKAAKAEYKVASERLQSLKARGPEELPLFDKKRDSQEVATEGDSTAPLGDGEAEGNTADDDLWRSVPLSSLESIPAPVLAKLAENDPAIETLGQLADWKTEFSITNVKGIGKAKAEVIEAAVAEYRKGAK